MKVPKGLKIPNQKGHRNTYSVLLQQSLYGLKQSERMWFNRLSGFLLRRGYSNNDDCPCMFIKKSSNGFCIISVYVDNLNIIGTAKDIKEAMAYLKKEFKMKDLGKTKFALGCSSSTSLKECLCTSLLIQRGFSRNSIWIGATL